MGPEKSGGEQGGVLGGADPRGDGEGSEPVGERGN